MLTRRTKLFITLAAATLCVAVAVVVGIAYAIFTEERTLEASRQTQAERAAAERNLAALSQLLKDTSNARATLASYVLTEDSVVSFLAHIERVARSSGVIVETRSLAVVPLGDSETFEELTLEVSVEGTFESVYRTLELFEHMPYQMRIGSVLLERREQGGEGGTLWRGTYTLFVTKYK